MEFQSLQKVSIAMVQERSVDTVLKSITEGLAGECQVALARIWLMAPGDICDACPMRSECPDQTRCLHLAASLGCSRVDPNQRWTRIDGHFRRCGTFVVERVEYAFCCDRREAGWVRDLGVYVSLFVREN